MGGGEGRGREGGGDGGGEGGDDDGGSDFEYETVSLMEPHKLFQNSFSLFQKRGAGWGEPVHTKFP